MLADLSRVDKRIYIYTYIVICQVGGSKHVQNAVVGICQCYRATDHRIEKTQPESREPRSGSLRCGFAFAPASSRFPISRTTEFE